METKNIFMKTFYTFIALLIGQSVVAQSLLNNASFEEWTEYSAELLDSFDISINNFLNESELPDTTLVEKSMDASNGAYSLYLKTFDLEGETRFGYAINGVWSDSGPQGGQPYSFDGDSIVFDYKADIMTGDTAYVIIIPKLNGSNITELFLPIYGSHPNWTTTKIPYFGATPDTVFFGAVSSNVLENDENAVAGSWLKIDNVGMKNTSNQFKAFPNGGFESWTDTTIARLDDWYDIDYTSTRSTDAVEGTYSLKLEVNSFTHGDGSVDTVNGIAANYDFENNTGLTQYNNISLSNYSGSFNYTPAGIDTGRIAIVIYYEDIMTAGLDTVLTTSTGGWSTFDFDLSTFTNVDSFRVYFTAGDLPGSTLMIDDLSLNEMTVSTEELFQSSNLIYPNPSSGLISISNAQDFKSYQILDMTGKLIESSNTMTQSIDLNQYGSGIYFIQLQDSNNKVKIHKVVIK